MEQHPFIFSNRRRYRWQRHLAFWAFWTLFQGVLYTTTPAAIEAGLPELFVSSTTNSLIYLPGHAFSAYAIMYFVVPRYVIQHKYLAAGIAVMAIVLVTGVLQALISLRLLVPIKQALFGQTTIPYQYGAAHSGLFHLAMMAGLRGGLTITGLAVAIKLMKHWYTEGQRNLQLQKEAVESQLQMLKAQVHPHFLFNTLNNIYSLTQNTSPTAAKMLMGLSDMLRYMLYECNQPLVPLAKELKMIDEYIALEKIRYGNRFELHVSFPEKADDVSIAPLLLLPLVENCFKHGISTVLDQPWLTLQASLDGAALTVKILNSKSATESPSQDRGIGLENVRRRLALMYPDKHELLITNEDEVFIVNLKLQLERCKRTAFYTAPAANAKEPQGLPANVGELQAMENNTAPA